MLIKKESTLVPVKPALRSWEAVTTEIILISQLRDMVRAISPRFYRSLQHRDEVYMAIIEALEDLEEELEDIEENMEMENEGRQNSPLIK